jgi:voltage-gated potassium channel
VFSVEYLARVWCSAESDRYDAGWRGRLRYCMSPYGTIDLVAILPFYLAMLPVDLLFLRVVRVLRVVRFAKLARYSFAMQLLGRVLMSRRYELGVTLFVGAVLLLIASASMYLAENAAQPDAFSSIPATMWWAIATLTTVGYGDLVPITSIGQIIGALMAIIGIGMFALPAGILGAAFVDELRERGAETSEDGRCATCGQFLRQHQSHGE